MEFNELPPSAKHSANLGMRDPEGAGSPIDEEDAVRHYELGQVVAAILKRSVAPMKVSEEAGNAPGAEDHKMLGDYPDDPTYIR
jgi:hypothetical protein